jgi:hypothetical protein
MQRTFKTTATPILEPERPFDALTGTINPQE